LGIEDTEERARSLKAAVFGRVELRRLAGNPMLLTIMALLHTHRGWLPDDRTRLYQGVVEHLLLRWDDTRKIGDETYPGVPELLRQAGPRADENSLQRAMAEAAYEAHKAGQNKAAHAQPTRRREDGAVPDIAARRLDTPSSPTAPARPRSLVRIRAVGSSGGNGQLGRVRRQPAAGSCGSRSRTF
jgi:hypothetical protein